MNQRLFCMENTGVYGSNLVAFLTTHQLYVWVEMPLRIKKAGSFERSTDDKLASIKIACYALRHQDKVQYWQSLQDNIEKLILFISQKDRVMESITQLTVPVNELRDAGLTKEAALLEKDQHSAIQSLKKSKEKIASLMLTIVNDDNDLHLKVKRILSIDGIGPVTAVSLLVYTKGFTAFENAKQLACYCGVVPYVKSSGTRVRFKPSLNPFANKKLTKLLHMCALFTIKNNRDLKIYFERKVKEGKNKMSVINAVRNKLLHRVFAVIRDERNYMENYISKGA